MCAGVLSDGLLGGNLKPENVTCPACDGPMVSRKNVKEGSRFWGCADFPRCRGTRTVDGEAPRSHADDSEDRLPSERQRENDRRRW